jgi:hypothetical protein
MHKIYHEGTHIYTEHISRAWFLSIRTETRLKLESDDDDDDDDESTGLFNVHWSSFIIVVVDP